MQTINAKEAVVKSNLPGTDYVINPYVGCTNGCVYCYASFMKRFYHIDADWGKFVIKKEFEKAIKVDKYNNKRILMSSVTDAYQSVERREKLTRSIISQFIDSEVKLEILTKSSLVIRDIDILKQIKNARVGLSIGLNNEDDRKLFESRCDTYSQRINALQALHEAGIENYVFISPIFPFLTDYKQIIKDTYKIVDFILVENLNLRGKSKQQILNLIAENYPQLAGEYQKIFTDKQANFMYWDMIKDEITDYCRSLGCEEKLKIYFYHDTIKKNAK